MSEDIKVLTDAIIADVMDKHVGADRYTFAKAIERAVLSASASDKKDAERYRWLRNNANVNTLHVLDAKDNVRCFHVGLDDRVDAAIAANANDKGIPE